MTIAPVVRTIEVKAPAARAFELFTEHFGEWWPKGRSPAAKPHVEVVLEPHAGGRWLEIDADGAETLWGTVLIWDPPGRLVLAWQLNGRFQYDESLVTEVELTFAQVDGGTLVTLEHRDLQHFGDDAERVAGLLGGGWPGFLGEYANFVFNQNP